MSISEFYRAFKEHGTLALAAITCLMTIIQITPIKLNPWSKLLGWIGKVFTGDLSGKIDKIDKKVDRLDERLSSHIEESLLKDLRQRRESILDFASAIAEGKRQYTKEQYEQMLSECDAYMMYCEEKNFKNAVAEESIAIIRHTYKQKLRGNSFLIIERSEDDERLDD